MLALAMVLTLRFGASRIVLSSFPAILLIGFVVWGFSNTVPYLHLYGLSAARDSVVWLYSLYALIIAVNLYKINDFDLVLLWYRKWFALFLIWVPVSYIVFVYYSDYVPRWPGSQVPVLYVKANDFAVHLAGAGTFLMLGLHKDRLKRSNKGTAVGINWHWIPWAIAAIIVSAKSRGGMLAIAVSVLGVMLIRANRRVVGLVAVVTLVVLAAIAIDVSVPLGKGREVSTNQIAVNIISIVADTERQDLQGTVEWRLEWWEKIVGYTLYGEYFWYGKGYGINLADSDGFQVVMDGEPLRSPHNGHMTILARSGIPGLLVWVLLNAALLLLLLRSIRKQRLRRQYRAANFSVWLLSYWVAAVVNMSFDVYLEGPQGGIWYWAIVGVIVAWTTRQKNRSVVRGKVGIAVED